MFTCSAEGPCDELPEELLSEISAAFSSHLKCIHLALKLRIGDAETCTLMAMPFSDGMALDIMRKWKEVHGEQATGRILYAALCEVDLQNLAEKFEDRLIWTGENKLRSCLLPKAGRMFYLVLLNASQDNTHSDTLKASFPRFK